MEGDITPSGTQQAGLANANMNFNVSTDGIFNQISFAKMKRNMREAYRQQIKYGGRVIRSNLLNTVKGAQAAGLHPLFALGAGGMQGSSPQVVGNTAEGGLGMTGQFSRQRIRPEEQMMMQENLLQEQQRTRFMKQQNQNMMLENHRLAKEIEMMAGGQPGTKGNPHSLWNYFVDDFSGEMYVAPKEEFAEPYDNMVGKGIGGYGNVRLKGKEIKPYVFSE